MEQNKVRTYLLYAIGEIALVMIGILLALQVNNWNEDRKIKHSERQLLQTIVKDIRIDSTTFEIFQNDVDEIEQLHYQIYLESRDGAVISDSLEVHDLRRGRAFRSILQNNHAENINKIQDLAIRESLLQYIRLSDWAAESRDFYNEYLIDEFRPFLAKHGMHDIDAIFNDTSTFNERRLSYVKYDKLREQYGTQIFDEHLFALKLRTQYYHERLRAIRDQNDSLRRLILEALNDNG